MGGVQEVGDKGGEVGALSGLKAVEIEVKYAIMLNILQSKRG